MTHQPVKPVADWQSYQDAKAAVEAGLPADYDLCRRIIEDHNHWLDGAGWPGHRTGDAVVDAAMRARIEPQFVADDVLGELTENRTNGLIGQEADIDLEPVTEPDSEEAKAAVAKEVKGFLSDLARWWDRTRFWEEVSDASDRVSYATRGAVWPFIADGNLNAPPTEAGAQPARALQAVSSFAQALERIDVHAPVPHRAVRYKDPTTQRPVAVVLRKVGEQERAEVWRTNPETGQTEALVFVEGGATPTALPVGLGGRIPLGEMRGKRIVTDPLRRVQYLLNFIMTVTGRTVESAGFRSVHVSNAEPQLMWLPTKPTIEPILKVNYDKAGNEISWAVRTPPIFGAGILNEWQGLEIPAGPNQPQQIATPGITALDPVDPAFATNAGVAVRKVMYRRAKQGHLATESTAESSGTAYQQARAQFESDLHRLKATCEGMIRDVLEAVLAMAGQMHPESATILQRYRLVVNLRISAGPVTADEARLAVELRNARAISQQTMQARVGVEDPAAEQTAIEADPMMRAEFWQKMSAAIGVLIQLADLDAARAGELLGLTPEQVAILAGKPLTPADKPAPAPAPALVA